MAAATALMAEEQPYDGAKRFSDYLTMPNGTKVAYDLFLPSKKGVVADMPLPTLFKFTPYSRAWTVFDKNGKNNLAQVFDFPWYMDLALRFRSLLGYWVKDELSRSRWVSDIAKSLYAILVADRPGTGASFTRPSILSWIESTPLEFRST